MGYKLHHPACRLNTRCGLNNWQFGERRRARPLSIGAGQAPPGAIGPLQASALGAARSTACSGRAVLAPGTTDSTDNTDGKEGLNPRNPRNPWLILSLRVNYRLN